jgi:hypothetical protein
MAPEQLEEGANEKSDLYSLGSILYEMLTGHLHLVPETFSRLHQQKLNAAPPSVAAVELDCPIWLDRLVASMLQADPRKRPHSAMAVVYALDEIKKVDQNLTPVVRQMTNGFSPLTAGADKSEARRLLGQELPVVDRMPLLQRTWFQCTVLVAIVAVIFWGAWPASNATLLRRGTQLSQSNELADLSRATEQFKRVVDRGGADEVTLEAHQRLVQTRGRILMARIKSGYIGLEPRTRAFADAWDAERSGKFDEAISKYQELIAQADEVADSEHFAIEAKKRIDAIEDARKENAEEDPEESDATQSETESE